MDDYSRQLCEIIEPAVTKLGYELIGVQYSPGRTRTRREGGLVRVYIDHPAGIDTEDCERVSHQVSGVLDVTDPIRNRYDLEVSSPGLDRPLFEPSHFEQFTGYRIRVKFNTSWEGRGSITGKLLGCQSDNVLVEENDVICTIPLSLIGLARLVPEL